MSNSPLVDYTLITNNRTSSRNHPIDRITPHCVVGQCTAEGLGEWFYRESTHASSNYGIDKDGRVGMYVEEKDRSWCSSSSANDGRAITIECASEKVDPYAMNDVVYEKLVILCADICKRNGKNKLLWIDDKDKALSYNPALNEMLLTVHLWFSNTACPGNWLYSRMSDLASKVTAILNSEEKGVEDMIYKVQVKNTLSTLAEAQALGEKLKKAGFDCVIVAEDTIPVTVKEEEPVKTIQVDSKVKVNKGAKSYDGKTISSFVFNNVYPVDALSGDRAVLDKKGICTPFHVKDLTLV